jgi:hypothetical protein
MPLAEFSYNNTMHSSTKQIPFFSNYGHHPRVDPFQVKDIGSPAVEDLAAHLATIHDELAFQLYEAQDRYKDYVDRNRKMHPNFHIGDQVWLLRQNIQTKRPSSKLNYQKLGPFQIITQANPVNYRLEFPPTMHIYPIFHISLLEPYKKLQIPSQLPLPPPPIEIDHDLEYEVEEILDSRLRRRRLEYFIHWKGYGSKRTWEPSSNYQNAFDKIQEFHH